jgi:DNA helicase-2/ATP-dependent DNA helicase PcrA
MMPDATYETRSALNKLVSLSKNSMAETLEDIVELAFQFGIESEDYNEEELAEFVLCILKECATHTGEIDFDDQIWLPKKLGLHLMQYDYVFVDETQDLNACQLYLTIKSCKPNGRIIAVGDDKQAIYRFRGADENAIERMVKELNAKVMPLSICYRCGKKIVGMAQSVVPDIEYWDQSPDGEINSISKSNFMNKVFPKPKDFVLSRTNAPLMPICLSLLRNGIPATVAGREVANSLKALIKRSMAETIPELVEYLERYRSREIEKLHKKNKNGSMEMAINDKVDTIIAISDGCVTADEIMERIDKIFSDEDTTGKVICSTVHKAKGLQSENVFILKNTFKPGRNQEETNIYYVAITRAQKRLNIVDGDY